MPRIPLAAGVFLTALLLLSASLFSADPSAEYKLKAEMLERFTRFIDWPAGSSVSNPSVPFVIAVVGVNPFGSSLERLKEMKIKDKRVDVVEIKDLSELKSCQMIFISSSQEKNLTEILFRIETKPVLTVGDTSGFAQKGVLINFYREGDFIRFEVNQSAIDVSGLKFSSRLMKLARIVKPGNK